MIWMGFQKHILHSFEKSQAPNVWCCNLTNFGIIPVIYIFQPIGNYL